jgi:hypothetical protein
LRFTRWAARKKSDYLFSLKGNQEKPHDEVKGFLNYELEKYRRITGFRIFDAGWKKTMTE